MFKQFSCVNGAVLGVGISHSRGSNRGREKKLSAKSVRGKAPGRSCFKASVRTGGVS